MVAIQIIPKHDRDIFFSFVQHVMLGFDNDVYPRKASLIEK